MSSYFECSGNGPIVTTKAGKNKGIFVEYNIYISRD